MLRAKPEVWAHTAGRMARRWWDSGPTRRRLRRRLVVFSLPVAAALLGLALVLATNLLTGARIAEDFRSHDIDALRADLERLDRWNILDSSKVPFAQGGLAVLEGRLADADDRFTAAMARKDACPTRINLELVRETQGDLAAAGADPNAAEQRYTAALAAVHGAPQGCFAGNADPDPDRQHIRQDAEPRLRAKIDSLHHRTPPPPPPAAPAPSAELVSGTVGGTEFVSSAELVTGPAGPRRTASRWTAVLGSADTDDPARPRPGSDRGAANHRAQPGAQQHRPRHPAGIRPERRR